MNVYDLSHPIENEMTYFPGDPQPVIRPAASALAPWRVSELRLGSHTGTHIDAASHYISGGTTIDQYPASRFVLPGVVAEAGGMPSNSPIEPHGLAEALQRLPKGGALIIRTNWDRYWKTEHYLRHPYLAPAAAQAIAATGARLVGIDALNVDSTQQESAAVHDILLGRDILIVENLTGLQQLMPGRVYQFLCLPLRLAGLDGSPVRAVAWEV